MSNSLLTERPAPTNHGLASDVLELHVITPGMPPKIARVADRTISLGAGPRCTVQLSAPGLRPMHCLITRTDTGLSVRRWANNTLLNGRSFSEAPLASGDRLSIGDCLVEIHSPATNEVFAESVDEQLEEPIATVDEAAEMIAADLALDESALDEPAVPAAIVEAPVIADPEAIAPAYELAGPAVPLFTPNPVEAVAAKARSLMAVPAHLLKPWQAAQGEGDSFAVEVVVAAPVVEEVVAPLPCEATLTPGFETPVWPALESEAPALLTTANEAETKDFVPLATPLVSPAVEFEPIVELAPAAELEPVAQLPPVVDLAPLSALETAEPLTPVATTSSIETRATIQRLRERLAWSRQRVSRLAALVRSERGASAQQAAELSSLRDVLAAVTAERDELRLSSQQVAELQQELLTLQTELEAVERQSEVLRTAPAEVASPVCVPATSARDPWAEFELDSTPDSTLDVAPTCELEAQLTASFAGWKTDPQFDQSFAELNPAVSRAEIVPPPAAELWEVESASALSVPTKNEAPADLWGSAEESTFADNSELAGSVHEPNADDACPDPFAEDAAEWSPSVSTTPPALLDSEGEESCAAEPWSLADALQSATPTWEGDAPRSPSEDLRALDLAVEANASDSLQELTLQNELCDVEAQSANFTAAAEPLEEPVVALAEEANLEAEEHQQPAEAEEEPQTPSEPKALSALFTPPATAPAPAASGAGFPSFIERYAHLLEEDASPEPIAPPVFVAAQPAPLNDTNEDESIDDYMERLMMRMRGEASSPTVERAISRGGSPTPAAPARPQAAKPQVTMPMTAEELAPNEDLLTSLDDMRRSGPTPESATDMTALRALANQNARHNIGVANVRQHKEFAFVKFGISLMVVGAGAVLALMAPDLLGVQMIASCTAMLVAGFYAGRTARLLKEAVKTARGK